MKTIDFEAYDLYHRPLSDPYWDDPELDKMPIPVIEAVIKSKLKSGDVIFGWIPYNDGTDNGKRRWVVILKVNNELRVIRVSHIEYDENDPKSLEKEKERLRKVPTNYIIEDWKGHGFTKPVYMVGSDQYRINERKVQLWTYRGHLSDDDLEGANQCIERYIQTRFDTPWSYIGWLRSEKVDETTHPSGNNNNCKLQSLQDVEKSKKINCVDIASTVHTICAKIKLAHRIIWTRYFDSEGNSQGHLYTIFKGGSNWYAFRYVPGEHGGEVLKYSNSTEDDVVKGETLYLKQHFDKVFPEAVKKVVTITLTDDDIRLWDRYVRTKKTQRELLDAIIHNHEVPTRESTAFEDIYKSVL
jgi:hypothetical protein